jgi:hypothetical protein
LEKNIMRKTVPIVLFVMLGLAAVLSAQDKNVDVVGNWEVSFETPMGGRTYIAAFTMDNEVLKVVMKSGQGTELKGEGKVAGNEVTWSVIVTGPMGEISLTFKGKVEDEAMTGTLTMGEAGESEFKAKKMK